MGPVDVLPYMDKGAVTTCLAKDLDMGRSSLIIGVGPVYHRVLKKGWQEGPRQREVVLMEVEVGVTWGHEPRNVLFLEAGKGQEMNFSSGAFRRNQPCLHLGFELLTSQTVRY